MKKKSLIFVICMLFALSGCNGPKAEILEMTETRQIMVKKLTLPSEEYSNIIQRNADGRRKGKIYSFIKDDVSDEAYTVFEFRMFDYPVEFEWFGDISIGDKFCDNDDAIVLGDSIEKRRLYFRGIRTTREEVLGRKEEDWKAVVSHSLKGKKEFFEKTEETDGLKVLCAVENEAWSGYVAFLYEYATERLFEVVYIEHNEIYNNDRALEMIQSVNHVDTQVEQIVFELTRECGEPIELYAEDIFDGNLLRLAEIFAYAENEIVVGENNLLFSDGAHVYTVTLNIVDTFPPEITYKGENDDVRYFLPGEELSASELAEFFFEASDRSGAVNINFADGREQLIVSEEEFGGEVPKAVTLQVSDASGNTREAVVYPTILEEERIPEWYSVFFEGKVSKDSVSRLGRVLGNASYQPDEYLQAWYKAGGIGLSISNESMENALAGYRRLEEMEFEVAVSEGVLPERQVMFYANMNLVPSEVLQRYAACEEAYELDEYEVGTHLSFCIPRELAESAASGLHKAEEIGISIEYDNHKNVLVLMNLYAAIDRNMDNKDFVDFVTMYDDNIASEDMTSFLISLIKTEEALSGYSKLKKLGVDVRISGSVVAEDLLDWFESAYNIPEELVLVYAENKWDVMVPEGMLLSYGGDNKRIHNAQLAEKAVNGYYVAENMGLEITFEEQMSFYDLARFYSDLPELPEEFLQMCAEENVKLCTSLWDLYRYTDADSAFWKEIMDSYERLETLGLEVDYRKGVTLFSLIKFYQAMSDIPENLINIYVKSDWEIPMSREKWSEYDDALNFMGEEIYEKAWNGYNKLQKHKIKVEYLDVWQPIKLIMFYAGIGCLPECVLSDYGEHGWKIILSDDNLKKKYNTGIEAAGITSPNRKLIEVISDSFLGYLDNVVIHEMGHYVDHSSSNNDLFYSSEKQTFKELYRDIKKQENGGKEWEYDSNELIKDITSLYYRPYSFTAEGEFFADSYFYYVLYPEELKAKYPEVYDFLDECTKKLQ